MARPPTSIEKSGTGEDTHYLRRPGLKDACQSMMSVIALENLHFVRIKGLKHVVVKAFSLSHDGVIVVYLHLESDLDVCVRISFEIELNSLIRVHFTKFRSNYMLYRGGIEDDAKGL
jgi:hypothetical protein